MREIKFRAWDKEFSQMLYGISIGGPAIHIDSKAHRGKMGNWPERSVVGWNNKEDFEVMQYAGLKDYNGQEIYEGDILLFPEAEERVDVIFDEGAFRVLFSTEDEAVVLTNKLLDANYDVEVIGNIYENPELLEAGGVEE